MINKSTMRYTSCQVVFQEVPNEISLAFSISGCSLRCKGCHSSELWNKNNGSILDKSVLIYIIGKYKNLISCVLFYGGEWDDDLPALLDICREHNLKTCLYTGLDCVNENIKYRLNYLKTGRWIQELGGLDSPSTNQRFYNLDLDQEITKTFQEK